MPVTNDQFDQLKIDKLKHLLEDMHAKGNARPFEIFVDSLKVVSKTEDPKDFDNYEYYINENTEKIRILIYNSNLSPRNDQYCFRMQQHKPDNMGTGLGEIETIIQEKLVARDREHETTRVKDELAATKQQLEEAEEYIAALEEKLELASNNKYKLKNIDLVDLGTLVLGKFAEKHADVLSQVGLEGLAANKPRSLPDVPPAEGAAAFEKKTEGSLKPEYLQYVPLLQQLDAAFDQKQLATVMQVLAKFSEEPANLKTVADLLNIQNP